MSNTSDEQQVAFERAIKIGGLDGEIALRRVVISRTVEDPRPVLVALKSLVKLVTERYRMSAEHEDQLREEDAAELRRMLAELEWRRKGGSGFGLAPPGRKAGGASFFVCVARERR